MLKAIVVGNLGGDPEMRYAASGMATLRFNVASNSKTRNAEGAWAESVEWVRCTIFGARAEALSQHLTRGQRIYADGRLEATRPWMDRTNSPKAGLELIVDTLELLGSRQDRDDGEPGYSHPPAQQTVNQPRRMQESTAVQGGRARGATVVADRDDGDDLEDLPF